jgi:hypothetical protein
MGHAEDHISSATVLEADHRLVYIVVSTSASPYVGGVHHRHQNLLRANTIHFCPHDGLDSS